MDTVRINGGRSYEFSTAYTPADNLLAFEFCDAPPREYGFMELYTSGGVKYAEFEGYVTVYEADGNVVTLSNDGSVKPHEDDPPDPTPSLEERVYDLEIAVCELAELNS